MVSTRAGTTSKLCEFCGLSRSSAFCRASCTAAHAEKAKKEATKTKEAKRGTSRTAEKAKTARKEKQAEKTKARKSVLSESNKTRKAIGRGITRDELNTFYVKEELLDYCTAHKIDVPSVNRTKKDLCYIVAAHAAGGLAAAATAAKLMKSRRH
jgi:hypothetical protein